MLVVVVMIDCFREMLNLQYSYLMPYTLFAISKVFSVYRFRHMVLDEVL